MLVSAPFALCRRRPDSWAAWIVTLLFAWTQNAASQAAEPFEVNVTCSLLSEGDRAAVAARLTGELLMSSIAGKLDLECENSELMARFQISDDEFVRRYQLNYPEEPADTLYQLGVAVIELSLGSFETASDSTGWIHQIEGPSAATDLRPFDWTSKPELPPTLVPRLRPETPAPTTSRPERGAEGRTSPVSRERSTASRETSTVSRQVQPLHLKYFLGLQLSYQYWGTEITGAVGPEIATGVRLKRFDFELSWTPFWGSNKIQDYSARDMRWAALATMRPFSWLRVGLGPLVSWLSATGPFLAEEGNTHSLRPGLLVFGEGVMVAGPVDWVFRTGLSAVTAAREIEENTERVVKIPWLQPVFGVGLRYTFDPQPSNARAAPMD